MTITPSPTSPEPTPGFAADIRPLFRDFDITAMRSAAGLDLGDHEQVAEWADRILVELKSGGMPCDGPWPDANVALFERWIAVGKPA